VFLAPGGNDSTCVRYPSNPPASPLACRTFDRAYRIAGPGDVVEMAGGTYGPDQSISRDTSKNYGTDSRHVVFRPASGATPRLHGRFADGGLELVGVEHLTITGLAGIGDLGIVPSSWCNATTVPKDVLLEGNRFKSTHLKAGDGITLRANVIGNFSYTEPGASSSTIANHTESCGATPLPRNVLIEGNTWENINRDGSPTHPECIILDDSELVTFRNNVFKDCPGFAILSSSANGATPRDVLLENNFFGCGDNGSPRTECAYPINMRPDFTFRNWTIRFNSFEGSLLMQDGRASPDYENVRVYGNVGHEPSDCRPGVSLNYNVWESSRCNASTEVVAPYLWVNESAGDFHLAGGVQAADNFVPASFCAVEGCPAFDIDGASRPIAASGARDAGADER
jgi:hypothetical protein